MQDGLQVYSVALLSLSLSFTLSTASLLSTLSRTSLSLLSSLSSPHSGARVQHWHLQSVPHFRCQSVLALQLAFEQLQHGLAGSCTHTAAATSFCSCSSCTNASSRSLLGAIKLKVLRISAISATIATCTPLSVSRVEQAAGIIHCLLYFQRIGTLRGPVYLLSHRVRLRPAITRHNAFTAAVKLRSCGSLTDGKRHSPTFGSEQNLISALPRAASHKL